MFKNNTGGQAKRAETFVRKDDADARKRQMEDDMIDMEGDMECEGDKARNKLGVSLDCKKVDANVAQLHSTKVTHDLKALCH